jgi:hypothetical protein
LVVTERAFDAPDTLPAASVALTVKVYAVEAVRPVTVAVVPVTVETSVEPLNTWYPVTPTLSVEPVHDSDTLVSVFDGDVRFVGAEGGVVSPLAAFVVTFSAFDAAETLPAASLAFTVKV